MNQQNPHFKPLFILVSLVLIVMTIILTVAQTRQSQDIRSSAASELVNCSIGSNAIDNDKEEKDLLDLINNYRQQKQLPPLKFQEDLNRAAAWQSHDMAKHTNLSHKDSSGRLDPQRIKDCGYNAPTQQTVENVAEWPTADKVFTEWKKSSGHNANMLCAACTDIGLAREKGSNDHWYWTMDGGVQTQSTQPTSTNTPTPTTGVQPTINPNPSSTPSASLTPVPQTLPDGTTGILLKVQIPGVGENGNENPLTPNREVTVTILDATKKEVAKVTSLISYQAEQKVFSGAIALPNTIESGSYLIRVKMPYSLTQTISSGFVAIEKGKLTVEPKLTLDLIDFDNTNTISITDFFAFRNCTQENECSQEEMDINDDGEINLLDYNVILDIFATEQGE